MSRTDLKIWDALLARAHGLADQHVRIGVLASKGGDEKVESEGGDAMTMTELAAIHEFGGKPDEEGRQNPPERSFIRRTFAEKQDQLTKACAALARKVVTDGMDPTRALGLLGQWGVKEIRATVMQGDGVPPPNRPSTVAKKGSSRPLVDTGRLMNAVSYEVVDGEVSQLAAGDVGGGS